MAGQAQVNGAGPGQGRIAHGDDDGEGDEHMEEDGAPAYPLEGIDGR